MFDFPNAPFTNQTVAGPGGLLYTWDGIKWVIPTAPGPYLPLTGGTLSGPLILSGDPTLPLGAATKQYIDLRLGSGSISDAPINGTTYGRASGVWVPVLPITGGTLTGTLAVTGQTITVGVNATGYPSLGL